MKNRLNKYSKPVDLIILNALVLKILLPTISCYISAIVLNPFFELIAETYENNNG